MHEFKLIRSPRLTLVMQIYPDGSIVVRAPNLTPFSIIEAFVIRQQNWIEKKRAMLMQKPVLIRTYTEGEQFYFLGNLYALHFSDAQITPIELSDRLCVASRHRHRAKKIIENWYNMKAAPYLISRAQELSQLHGIIPKQIKLSHAKRRWGSCSPKGNINLAYRLIMAPKEVIDYVIIHELVHLFLPNHSKHFWQKVYELVPDYKAHRNWLKQNHYLLNT